MKQSRSHPGAAAVVQSQLSSERLPTTSNAHPLATHQSRVAGSLLVGMFRPPLSPYLLRAPIPSALPFFAKFFGTSATPPPLTAAGPSKFAFSYGVAFAGKPRRRGEQIPRGLAGGGEKGSWRSAMLALGKERDAGEDFFMLREGEESQVRCL